MTKNEMLRLVRKARSAHIRCRSYAQALIAGLSVAKGKATLEQVDCHFNQWYYGEGLRLFARLASYRAIEEPMEVLQDLYQHIDQRVRQGRLDDAKVLLQPLLLVSRSLLEAMDQLEQDIQSLVDDNSYWPNGLKAA